MPFLWVLIISLSPELVRIPVKTAPPDIPTGKVWVYFTDKGIFHQLHYQLALDQLKQTAPLAQRQRREKEPIAGFDFDDLPVHPDYIREIEAMGARLRTVSRWLNAASFEMPPELIPAVYSLPFVYEIRPVGHWTEPDRELTLPLKQPEGDKTFRAVDTADAHRFYGAAWDQAQMLGVPELFYQGWFGSGVKLAIFDTGLKLKNQAVKRIRIYRQYDFLSGDNFYIRHPDSGTVIIPTLRYLGMVKEPALAANRQLALLTFTADSFNYTYGLPKRALFFSASQDGGRNWSPPSVIIVSNPYFYTYENLQLLARDSVFYLTFNELDLHVGGAPTCYLGYFINQRWQGRQTLGSGKQPHMAIYADTLYLTWLKNDSVVSFYKALISSPAPSRILYTEIAHNQPLSAPQVSPQPRGGIILLVQEKGSGRVLKFYSQDGGVNFASGSEVVSAGADRIKLVSIPGVDSLRLLLYQDQSGPVRTKLTLRRSLDWGSTWDEPVAIDSGFSFGDYHLTGTETQLFLVYESGGNLYQRRGSGFGTSWGGPEPVDTTGFCYSPRIAPANSFSLWYRRGDETAVWEDSDTLRFSYDQPNHGTRMASLIAGYQPYSMMGIAPGVNLIVARTEYYKTSGNRGYEYNLEEDTYIQALEWAERLGVDIVSTSLGYRGWYRQEQFDGKTAPVSIACDRAAHRGLLIVTAMGNRDTTEYPWPEPYIVAPGDAEGVITCGGIEKNLTPWRGTGTGPTSDGRIKPDLVALADTVAVAAPDSENFLEGSVGTSCATALIAGACALLKEAHPHWSAESIKAALYSTATRSVKSCTFGYGVPKIDSAFQIYPPSPKTKPIPGDQIFLIYPNPLITGVHPRVYFALDISRVTPDARITIYTTSGKKVRTIQLNAAKIPAPGRYYEQAELEQINSFWDGLNEAGKPAGSGLYIAVLKTTFGKSVSKFTVIR